MGDPYPPDRSDPWPSTIGVPKLESLRTRRGIHAVLIDRTYLNSAHLGSDGPTADGLALARQLTDQV